MIEDGRVPRNAQPVPYPPAGQRVEPNTSNIRIRIDGVWYDGYVQRWTRLDNGGWAV